jgi:hypothetical protein
MDVRATSKSRKYVIANCQAQIVRMDNRQPDIDFVPVVKLFSILRLAGLFEHPALARHR